MNISIELPDEMNQQLTAIENVNAFIVNALKTALAQTQTNSNNELLNLSEQDRELIENSVRKHKTVLLKLAK